MGRTRRWRSTLTAVAQVVASSLLVSTVECKATPAHSPSGPPPRDAGTTAAKGAPSAPASSPAGISATDAAMLEGTWEVEHVGVNMADQPHWKWRPDDPQLIGREFVVRADEIRFADFKQANCKPATWKKKTHSWSQLVDDLFLGPASKQTPADFRVKASPGAKVQVFEPCALATPGQQAPGNNWVLGSWVVVVGADKLIMEFDSDSVLYLARRSKVPKASFDCAKAKTATEKAICADANLAAWDRSVALAWRRLRESDRGIDATTKEKHTKWLATRDACGTDAACLAAAMAAHTGELVSGP